MTSDITFEVAGDVLRRIDERGNTRAMSISESYSELSREEFAHIRKHKGYEELHVEVVSIGMNSTPTLRCYVKLRDRAIYLTQDCIHLGYVFDSENWIPISQGALREFVDLLRESGSESIGPLTTKQAIFLSIQGSRLTPKIEISWNHAEIANPHNQEFKSVMSVTPYPYQLEGYQWLSWLYSAGLGGILGDEMGLGKTLQIIMLLQNEVANSRSPNLVICPPSLLENWRREIVRFSGIEPHIHQGEDRVYDRESLYRKEIVLISYDAIRQDFQYFQNVNWNVVAVDEAQYIKNPESQRSIAVKTMPRRMGIAITGTPIENSLTDLWSIFDFSTPGLLGSLDWFNISFNQSQNGALELKDLIRPLILRRRVNEVAKDLPALTVNDVAITMPKEIATKYVKLNDRDSLNYIGALKRISIQRRLCNHLDLDENTGKISLLGKMEYLRDSLIELALNGEKALIFVPYTQAIYDLRKWYRLLIPNSYSNVINGATPIDERQNIVDEFSKFTGSGLLLLNPKAGGVGLNITAANHVFHFSPDWNPAVVDQASARSYRRGQKLPVTIHNLFYADSIEEYMVQRLGQKRVLSEDALEGTSTTPTLEELNEALKRMPVI